MKVVATREDCKKTDKAPNYAGQFVWLDMETCNFKSEYRCAKFQLFFATSGFGCDPEKMGRKVFGYHVADDENCPWLRTDIIGIASEESLEEYTKIYPELKDQVQKYKEIQKTEKFSAD